MTNSFAQNELKRKHKDDKMKKLITIVSTSLILLIPIGLMALMISDRESYRQEAVNKVKESWADAQIIKAPKMSYDAGKDGRKYLELNNYEATLNINTEVRKKGIFKVPVYVADVNMKGDFKNNVDLKGKKVKTEFSVSDSRGFESTPTFKINGGQSQTSQDTAYTTDFKANSSVIPFEISYKIRGLNDIAVALAGVNNKVSMNGNWKDPSFEGNFLPKTREVTTENFTAEWSVPKIALSSENKPLYAERTDESINNNNVAKVSLFVATDNYKLTEKVLKYAFLFLLLTFLSYFVFEITSKEKFKIHPIQYCLLGGAILIFYLLLVSMSEFIPFWISYVISAFMIISMIFTYTYFVITKKSNLKFAQLIAALMTLLYTYLYILLQIQDFALLMGSIGLFIIIAIVMYITRNVEWYSE